MLFLSTRKIGEILIRVEINMVQNFTIRRNYNLNQKCCFLQRTNSTEYFRGKYVIVLLWSICPECYILLRCRELMVGCKLPQAIASCNARLYNLQAD